MLGGKWSDSIEQYLDIAQVHVGGTALDFRCQNLAQHKESKCKIRLVNGSVGQAVNNFVNLNMKAKGVITRVQQ